ncbi:MAG: TonB-dependent receptor [Prevotellaceae bacterium]|jgi:TonB-linked SusC/RagA family outer membrane protein|nr:TonB-dependent receptor [Prevotellaceae bacterium]
MRVFKKPKKSGTGLWKRAGLLAGMFLWSLLSVLPASAQQKTITGTVVDAKGETVIGASVVVKGTIVTTLTDADGRFAIQGPADATIVISLLGYVTQEVPVQNRTELNVVLEEDVRRLEEVIVVGYGTQKKVSITGAVSQIQGEELLKAPASNVTNLLAGRIAGVISLQESGQPGSDGASLLVRGSGAKYVVDGVSRDFSQIDPNDIATISVLKDASSAAVYGMDASAVIIVTTKRGQVTPSKINFTASYGVSTNTEMLQLLDAPQYAYWYNKARILDGNEPVFSQEHVRKMLAGEDGWGNTNWYEKTFGIGTNGQYNVNASGGTENIKYFASLGYFNQTGNVVNCNFDRFSLRSNIDAKIAKHLTLTFDVSGRIEKRARTYFGVGANDWSNIPQQAVRALPFAPTEWDGLPVSTRTSSSFVSPMASAELGGYRTEKTNILQTTIALNYDLPWVKGLSAKFAVSYDYSDGNSKQFSTPYETMVATRPSSPSESITYVKSVDPRGGNATLSEGATYNNTLTTNTSLRYENKFGLHSITALALMETRQNDANSLTGYGLGYDIYALDELGLASDKSKYTAGGNSSQARWAGFLGRINYSYADKYLAEVTVRYDGSYLFAGKNISGSRWVTTPAASLGWRMSEEEWFKNALPFVDHFKLRGGIGLTGLTDGVKPYFYLNTLSILSTPAVVIGGVGVPGLNTSVPANVVLTWAKSLQYNAGFDAVLWKGLLGIEFDVFYKYIYDMPAAVAGSYPDSFGGYVPGYENVNKQDHKGFEVQLSHENRIGEFFYRLTVNGTYAYRRWLHFEESPNLPDYGKLTGKEVGSLEGLIAVGLFQSEEEIANSATIPGKAVRVGDVKYLDRNGDGIISHYESGKQDWGYVGKSAYPDFTGGLSFYAEWKGIDIAFLWQGSLGRTVALTGVYPLEATPGAVMPVNDNTFLTKAFYHDGNTPLYLVENSWTPDNPNAEFARLSITGGSNQSAWASTFWYRNGDYLRLKSLQVGYNFPKKLLDYVGIGALRVYVEGQNLLTFSELNKYGIDPEQPNVNNGYYPQQRVMAAGIKLTF